MLRIYAGISYRQSKNIDSRDDIITVVFYFSIGNCMPGGFENNRRNNTVYGEKMLVKTNFFYHSVSC